MKFSGNWLKELTGLNGTADAMAERFAELGFPVAEIRTTGVSISNIVSAKILSVEKHPNADKLSVTQIDDGSTKRTVVCGANNIAPGQVVPLAKPGTKFPNGLEISVAKLRGVESQGMLCSERELGLSDSHAGILQLPPETKLGVEISRVLGGDTIFDLEIPPNRPDVLSHVGMARELSALAGKKLKPPVFNWKPALKGNPCKIENREPRLCFRYLGKNIHGVKVAPSPAWISQRLTSCGIRPINNIVDITNYVLLEWGHPLHAFDLAKLKGAQVVVRRAKEGEKIEALDGKSYGLKNDDLVIADAENPVAIAGIMGGQSSGVTEATTDLLLESAVFDPTIVRTTSKRLGLKSESSIRFEKGTHAETALSASLRAAQLISELAGGQPGRATDSYPKKPKSIKIEFQLDRVMRLIGTDIPSTSIEKILTNLDYAISKSKKAWNLTPPGYRLDVGEEADVTEDVLRLYGYNKIPDTIEAFRVGTIPPSFKYEPHTDIAEILKGWGFNETLTSSMSSISNCELFSPKDRFVELANPLSQEESILRPLLLPNLLNAVQLNIHHQRDSVFLFEIGARHFLKKDANLATEEQVVGFVGYGDLACQEWNVKLQEVDFFFLKGYVEGLSRLSGLNLQIKLEQNPLFLHPHQSFIIQQNGSTIGWGGMLHPEIAKRYDMKRPCIVCEFQLDGLKAQGVTFKEFSKFTHVERDIAIVVDQSLAWARLAEVIKSAGGSLLREFQPFDIFSGGSMEATKKSIAFRCKLQDDTRTLSDNEITKTIDAIKTALSERCGAQLR